MSIQADQYYPPADLEGAGIAKTQTFAQWRHEGRGPAYIKVGSRVLYHGKDVLAWLNENRVSPEAA